MIGMIGQRRMVDFLYLGMARQIFGDLNGIGHMTLYAQRQRLESLKQEKCVKRADAGSGVAQQHRPDSRHEGSLAGSLGETGAVI